MIMTRPSSTPLETPTAIWEPTEPLVGNKHGKLPVRVGFFDPGQNHGGQTGWTGQMGQIFTVERGWNKGVKMRENNISEVNDKKGDIETG